MAEASVSVIKSVTRVFEVLEMFERLKQPLTSSKVGRQLNYPASSSLALLKSMVELGYLSFDAFEKTYFPTVRLTILGQWIERAAHLGDSSLTTVMEALIRKTGESAALSCQTDLAMQFVHSMRGPQHVTHMVDPGELAPLFQSSVGIAALTVRPDAEIKRLVERYNRTAKGAPDKAGRDRVVLADLLKTVEGARQRGCFVGYDMYIDGVGAVSWLLPTHEGGRGMVLSISGPSSRIRAHEEDIVRTSRAVLQDYGLLAPEPLRRRA